MANKFNEYSDKELRNHIKPVEGFDGVSVLDFGYQNRLRSWLLDKYYYRYHPVDIKLYEKRWDPRIITHPVYNLKNPELSKR